MARIAPFAFLLVAAFRCHGDSKSGTPTNGAAATSGSPGASASNAASVALPPDDIFHKDPCRYVSQAETEAYLGPLLTRRTGGPTIGSRPTATAGSACTGARTAAAL
jgi:hypothetical protein